jgi:putative DNA primase/helicase
MSKFRPVAIWSRNLDIRRAAALLGGEMTGRSRVACPGPGHSPLDRSLSVSFLDGVGGFLVHSFAGDGWQACRDHVKAHLGLQDEHRPPARARVIRNEIAAYPGTRKNQSPIDVTSRALDLWHEALPLEGSPAELYLANRGVSYEGDALRWHPGCPFGKDRVGCMLGLVRNIRTDEPQGIHRTAIDGQGCKLSHLGSNGRLSLGPTRGGAVKLTEDSEVTTVIAIGEGIETTLSIRKLPGLELMSLWTVLNANGIQGFPELRGVETVWIAADHDASGTGQRAAQALARRLEAAGIEAVIIEPTIVGADINDKVANV